MLISHLERMGFDVTAERVQTAEAFAAALVDHEWDVVLADHSMPRFDSGRALQLLKARDLDVPFVISGYGWDVEIAYDGPAVLAVLERFEPAGIILDIGLPGMDGFEVARRIRGLSAHKTTTMIALTGYGQPSDHDRSRSAGFDQHLVKPVQVAQLLGALAAWTT